MKKFFIIIALGSGSLLSADQYNYGYEGNYPDSQYNVNYYPNDKYYINAQQDRYNQGSSNYQGRVFNDQSGDQSIRGFYQREDWSNAQPSPNQYNKEERSYQSDRGDRSYQRQENRGDSQLATDREIARKVRELLASSWFSKGFQDVSYDIRNGDVNLKGSVDSEGNKNKIEEKVSQIAGVKQVNNQITVDRRGGAYSDHEISLKTKQVQDPDSKYGKDSAETNEDKELNQKIRDRLSGGWYAKENETFILKTKNGDVEIIGTVKTYDDAQKIQNEVKKVEGVKTVTNEITVRNN